MDVLRQSRGAPELMPGMHPCLVRTHEFLISKKVGVLVPHSQVIRVVRRGSPLDVLAIPLLDLREFAAGLGMLFLKLGQLSPELVSLLVKPPHRRDEQANRPRSPSE